MSARGPFDLVCQMAALLDGLGIPYALGGSMASSLIGEPRSTLDVDVAVQMDGAIAEAFLELISASFYVPVEAARQAVAARSSFNAVDTASALKVDLFVLGDGLLDRRQIERRRLVAVPGAPQGIWVTAPEDQVLRKLDWFVAGGSTSDRQWRDVLGILRIHARSLDLEDLAAAAEEVGLAEVLDEALEAARRSDGPGGAT